jgi:hypothetical protein
VKPGRLQGLALVVAVVGCSKGQPPPVVTLNPPAGQPAPEETVDRPMGQPHPEVKEPDWVSLYGTRCVFHEGRPETPCLTPYTKLFFVAYGRGATVCCPGSPEESVPPPERKEPPWAPEPCMHTGIDECDTYTKAQYDLWKHGTPEERIFLRGDLDGGCTNYYREIRREGIDIVRRECVMGLGLLRPVPPRSTVPARAPAPVTTDQALTTIGRALKHQLTPLSACPHAVDECDAYVKAFYRCWKRTTPEVRSFLEPSPENDCGPYSVGDLSWLQVACQDAHDSVVEHPACKPSRVK